MADPDDVDREDGQDWVLSYTPERRDEDDRRN
jgi:hypothetical protein